MPRRRPSKTHAAKTPAVPEGWETRKLSEVARIAAGLVDPQLPRYRNLVHIGPENIVPRSTRLIDLKTAREIGLSSGKYRFDRGAIIYSKIRPNLNKVALPSFDGLCSADAYPLWPNEALVSREYLFYLMISPDFVRQAVSMSMRSGMPKVNRDELYGITLAVPPPKEQRAISDLLHGTDKIVDGLDSLIAAKERRKQALMQRLLMPPRNFQRLEKGRAKSSKGWQTNRLGDIAEEVVRRNEHGVPVLSCTKTRGLVPSLEYFGRRVHSVDTSNYKVVRRGEFAYATNHIEEGSIGSLDFLDAGLVSPMYTVFRVRAGVHGAYLFRLLKTERYRRIFEARTRASVNRRGSLRWPEFSAISVTIPPLDQQRCVNDLLDTCGRELALLRRLREAFEKQKRGLMQVLLTGQVRVKVAKAKCGVRRWTQRRDRRS